MLKKLIKYDMKALSRTLILLHAIALIFAFIGRIFVMNNLQTRDPNQIEILYILAFFLALAVIHLATLAAFSVHFYKSLFSRQGYLSWTLPVTANQHLISKLLVAFLWSMIDFFVLILSVFIFFIPSTDIAGSINQYSQYFGDESLMFILITLLYTILSTVASILTLYFSATIGQLFANHRILVSLMTYGGFVIISQVIAAFVVFTSTSTSYYISGAPSIFYQRLLFIGNVFSALQIVAFYILIYYITKRKLNLA